MRDCEQCGYPLPRSPQSYSSVCPKCGAAPGEHGRDPVLEVDVAHQGETWEMSRTKILQAVDQSMFQKLQGVKIIHGYGSSTGYAVIGPRAIALMRHLAEEYGGRYARDKHTEGASLIWWNRASKTRQTPSKNTLPSPYSTEQSKSRNSGSSENWFEQALRNHKS